MQAAPTIASSLIRAGAVQTYSAAVNWKSPTPFRLKCNIDASFVSYLNRVGIGICIRDELGQYVLSRTEWIALLCRVVI
ncbi:cytochrome p450, partial [Trifolium pratense]